MRRVVFGLIMSLAVASCANQALPTAQDESNVDADAKAQAWCINRYSTKAEIDACRAEARTHRPLEVFPDGGADR